MNSGELIVFTEGHTATVEKNNYSNQVPMWPDALVISEGCLGVVLESFYYKECGFLFEVLIDNHVCVDIPYEKIDKLPTATA